MYYMGCCGGIDNRKKKIAQEQQTVVQPVNNEVIPVQSTQIVDNINSQRAAEVLSNKIHKLRFWRG